MPSENSLPIIFLNYTSITAPTAFANDSYDIIYVLSGRISLSRANTSLDYSAGDICLLVPGDSYLLTADGENTFIHLGIASHFIEQHLGTYKTLICDSVLEPNNNYTMIRQMISGISSRYLEDASEHALAIHGLLFQLLDLLKKHNCFVPSLDENIPEKYRQRIRIIMDYIDEHYQEPLTLASLSESLFLTPQYLSKFFKKYFHENFKEYLLDKRLFHAYRDICYTDDSITDIAIRHGFSDITAFGKAFRSHYGDTPGKYRKSKHSAFLQEEYDTIDQKELIDSTLGNDKLYMQANIVDVTSVSAFPRSFTKLMNIGSAQNLLMENFHRQLAEAQSPLNLCYLRIQGLISSAFIPKVLPDFEYYFLDVENVLDFLYENNFYPMIELSRLPFNSSLQPASQEISSIPRNRRFYELLEAFLHHCTGIYPPSWTSKWKFELWKTPKESAASYITDYKHIYSLLKRYLPDAEFGGPGFDAGSKLLELEDILKGLSSAAIWPDFISAYFNLLTKIGDSQYVLSTDKDLFLKHCHGIRNLTDKYFPGVSFDITEWNSVIIPDTPIQYSCFQAAFICKTALELNRLCDMMGYWIFSDNTSMQDPTRAGTFYFWGQGLFNKDNIAMPSCYAFLLLNRLGTTLISQGENYCVTKSAPGHYQIMTFNYSHFLPSAILDDNPGSSFSEIYKLFENTLPLQIQFELHNVVPGTYRISRFLLDRANGSILDLWIGGFAVSNIDEFEYLMDIKLPSPDQLDYYQRSCIPEERTIFLKTEDTLSVGVSLTAHNVCVWDIIRQI